VAGELQPGGGPEGEGCRTGEAQAQELPAGATGLQHHPPARDQSEVKPVMGSRICDLLQCGSGLRILLFISMRIQIQGVSLMLILTLVSLQSHKSLFKRKETRFIFFKLWSITTLLDPDPDLDFQCGSGSTTQKNIFLRSCK
jgi:hypothetical protein